MKMIRILPFFAALAVLFSGCLKDSCDRVVTYTKVEPVYRTWEEIRTTPIEMAAARPLENPGKIYTYQSYIFINEENAGIHVIDNSIPSAPQQIGFITLEGNEDISIKNGLLYANNYMDLVTIEVSNLPDIQVVGRTKNVFPVLWNDEENQRILAYYDTEEVTEEMSCDELSTLEKTGNVYWSCLNCFDFFVWEDLSSSTNVSTGSSGGTGTGGSMARFSIVGDYLYVVDNTALKVFSLTSPPEATLANTVHVGWGIETLFPWQDKLFIGSNSGMFIFDNSNPTEPVLLSEFQHARACDPVFVKDNFAYVTLRDGTVCQGFVNQLDLIDISDLTKPVLLRSFPMDNPHGLSILDNTLLLCEGNFGLKTFDIENPLILDQHLADHVPTLHAFDVIALPGNDKIALVIGDDGFYQFDFSDPEHLELLSKIEVR